VLIATFNNVAVNFIGGGNGRTGRKSEACRKLLTNYQHNIVSSTPHQGVEIFQHLISLLRLQHSCSHLSSNRQLTLLQNNFEFTGTKMVYTIIIFFLLHTEKM
jgi:hypothetical protein